MANYAGTGNNDRLSGTSGSDTFTYDANINRNNRDVFDGGRGNDTLVLKLARADWFSSTLQRDIQELLRYLSRCSSSDTFSFDAFNLTIKNFEAVKIFVDGVELSAADDRVTARDDAFSLNEGASVSGQVLANDSAPDLVRQVNLVRGPSVGRLTFNADGTFTFDADGAFDWLAAGRTTTVSFVYQVVDADGDRDMATVTLTITGSNDAPLITGGVTQGSVHEVAHYKQR